MEVPQHRERNEDSGEMDSGVEGPQSRPRSPGTWGPLQAPRHTGSISQAMCRVSE